MKLHQAITYFLSIPKTIYFNFRSLPFKQACRFPIFVSYKVKILAIKRGIIRFSKDTALTPFMVRIGFNGTEEITPHTSKINFKDGMVIFNGKCSFAEGCVIGIAGGGEN